MPRIFNKKVLAIVIATSVVTTTLSGTIVTAQGAGSYSVKNINIVEENNTENLIKNNGFENITNINNGQWGGESFPDNWKASPWGTTYVMPYVTLDNSVKTEGEYSVKFESIEDNTRGWIEQSIEVQPNTTYILEADLMSENVKDKRFGIQVLEYVGNSSTAITTDSNSTVRISLDQPTQEWKSYKIELKTGENTTRISLRPYLGTHLAMPKGAKAWVDNLSITKKADVKLEGITLPNEIRVAKGSSVTIKPGYTPENATNKNIIFKSEDESIATVSASGLVVGQKEGTTNIIATSEDGGYIATCKVDVEEVGYINHLQNGSFEETKSITSGIWKDKIAPINWESTWVPTNGAGLVLEVNEKEFTNGTKSIHVMAPNQSRVAFNTSIEIDSTKAYKLAMNIKTKDINGTGAYFRVQYLDANNNKTQDKLPSITPIAGTKDWSNYELELKDIPKNTVTAKIEVFFENATGEAWFDDAKLIETYDFSLSQSSAKLFLEDTLNLEPIFSVDISNKKLTWTSSDESIVTVEDGVVVAKGVGVATVTATTIDGNKAVCNISVEDRAMIKVYEQLREKWSDRITINNISDANNEDYIKGMEKLEKEATDLWNTMNKFDENLEEVDSRKELWPQFQSDKVSAHITSTISNLRTMTKAYASKGCSLYNNEELGRDIINALDWFYANRYNENIKMYNNWWDWDIGAPQRLNDVLVMMYDELSEEQINNHLKALNRFVPTPVNVPGGPNPLTGANLLDTAIVSAVSGIVEGSSRRLIEARDAISNVLPYVTSSDGFYEDGSFIQHYVFPYAGGYGGSLMTALSGLLFLTEDSPWEVTDPLISNVYDWITNAFEPLYHKGAIMDMVNGRGISRENNSDHDKGRPLLAKMFNLAQTAPEPKKNQILSFIKESILEDELCNDTIFDNFSINDVLGIKELLENDSIPARGDLNLSKVYGAMDRVVHHKEGFSLGISMFSSRVGAFEFGNGENAKAWHTADGMTYLYNSDLNQFGDDFWPTVDPMRLPGITTDHSERTNKEWARNVSTKDWVGGSTINDIYGAAGMEFEMEPGKSTLTGKKSWFMFDDEIVALGAGITSSDNNIVETIVENRKIKDSGDNKLIVNGGEVLKKFGEKEIKNARWAFLSGNTEAGTDTIGYYFPETVSVKAIKESRTGTWNEINVNGSKKEISKNYASLAIEHGENPENVSYSYVLLPNKSQKEVKEYSKSSDIEIITNTADVQAVRENKLGILGINFWEPSKAEYVTAENPCSIMIDENNDKISLGISDPTHKLDEVKIILDKSEYAVESKDDTVSVENSGDKIEIVVNTDKSMGKTHKLNIVKNIK